MTEQKRDRWGRYLLPDPETGKERSWTRATTFAGAIADTYNLTRWKMRMAIKGIAQRPDLLALAASYPLAAKGSLNQVAEDALEHAGGSSGANLGTALHGLTQQLDQGELPDVPEPWTKDIAAYNTKLMKTGIVRNPAWVERVVVLPSLGVAGTLDRILASDNHLYIADLKTGADLYYYEIAVQLALYAHGEFMWDGEKYEPMPDVSKERALVIHLPVGKGRCDLYWVDIMAGWDAAHLCGDVRNWRTRKDLATPFEMQGRLT